MIHRHLDYDPATPMAERGLAALDDLLDRGDLDDWAPLAKAVAADPDGELASKVLAICAAHPMYGTSLLWQGWITELKGSGTSTAPAAPAGLSLAELRVRRNLRQVDVAIRLGATQPDVSKLESRRDLRVSTLTAYIAATGGRLDCRAIYPDEVVDIVVRPSGTPNS